MNGQPEDGAAKRQKGRRREKRWERQTDRQGERHRERQRLIDPRTETEGGTEVQRPEKRMERKRQD